jgi:protein-disulfide isomerase
MGKSRSKKREAERKAKQRQQRNRNITITVVVIAVLAVVGVILATRPITVNVDDEILTRYAGLPTSTTDRGFPVLGNPDAPASLVEYSSFDCPSCQRFHDTVTKDIIDRVRSGEASFTYVPVFGTGSIPNGEDAAIAAICAGEQGMFWEYHDLLFEWQAVHVAAAFQPRRLTSGAIELGLDMDAFNSCLTSEEAAEVIDNARSAFAQSQSTGTPSLFINDQALGSPGLAAVNQQIDVIMANADPVPVEIVDDEAVTPDEEVDESSESDASDEDADGSDETDETSDAEASDADGESAEDEATEEATEEAEEEPAEDEATEEAMEDEDADADPEATEEN